MFGISTPVSTVTDAEDSGHLTEHRLFKNGIVKINSGVLVQLKLTEF